jgi:hypothetical protein
MSQSIVALLKLIGISQTQVPMSVVGLHPGEEQVHGMRGTPAPSTEYCRQTCV